MKLTTYEVLENLNSAILRIRSLRDMMILGPDKEEAAFVMKSMEDARDFISAYMRNQDEFKRKDADLKAKEAVYITRLKECQRVFVKVNKYLGEGDVKTAKKVILAQLPNFIKFKDQ